MRGVWTLARHSLSQALRMKVAAAFIVLLAVTLCVLPAAMKGDGTLAGRIRTFLTYSTGATSVLLSLATILVSTMSVTSDISGRQIFIVMSKPLPRWQYVVGRWLGVVMLNVILLTAAGGTIYALAQHMRGDEELNAEDRRAVETEIFTARVRVKPDPFDQQLKTGVEERIKRLRDSNGLEDALRAYVQKYNGDRDRAQTELQREIEKQVAKSLQTVAPPSAAVPDEKKVLRWRFSGIDVSESGFSGGARYAPGRRGYRDVLRFEATPRVVGRLVFQGPVRVNGVDGRVVGLGKDYFHALFKLADLAGEGRLADLKRAKTVKVQIDPTIQITYKASPSGRAPNDELLRRWRLLNKKTGYQDQRMGKDPIRVPATLTVSSRVVSDQGVTEATYVDLAPTSVTILNSDVFVLYRLGAFGPNFFRAMCLVLIQLTFLAGLGVMAGTFLSSPIARLLCFASIPFSIIRGFLTDAVKMTEIGNDFFVVIGHYVMKVMGLLLPDFAGTSAGQPLVHGMYISWSYVAMTAAVVVAVQTTVILAIGCWIFQKRELAQVQV